MTVARKRFLARKDNCFRNVCGLLPRMVKILSRTSSANHQRTCEPASNAHFRRVTPLIEFQRTEIAVLRGKLGKRRILLNDDQRRRLAVKANVLGRKVLQEIGTLVTPDTILRWHRRLVAP